MEDLKVFKANDLVNARYKLSTNELKFVLWTVANIKPDDMDFWTYTVKVKDIDIDTKYLKAVSRSLVSKTFEIMQDDGWLLISWFSSIRYSPANGVIELSFDPRLKPYLLQLKEQFTAYTLSSVLPMRSAYSIRLYELVTQYLSIGHRVFDLSELRDILGVPTSYRIQDLRRQVLDRAMREINSVGVLTVSYELIKTGRSYSAVRFDMSKVAKPSKESLKDFIARVRATYVNKTLLNTTDAITKKKVELSVSANGLLYNKLDPAWRINKKRSMKIWRDLQRTKVLDS